MAKISLPIVNPDYNEPGEAPQASAPSEDKPLTRAEGGDVMSEIRREVSENAVFLYMKGTPDMPMCGFSARVAGILNHLGVQYGSVNVLEDFEKREGIKVYAEWPTIPQLYIRGEFVGGCDIVTEMYQSGELQEMLAG